MLLTFFLNRGRVLRPFEIGANPLRMLLTALISIVSFSDKAVCHIREHDLSHAIKIKKLNGIFFE
jgi:hypothetical protein